MRTSIETTRAAPAVDSVRLRWLELTLIFVFGPLVVYALVYGAGFSLFAVLGPLGLVLLAVLALDRSFPWRTMLTTWIAVDELAHMLALFFLLGPLLVAIAYLTTGDWFLRLPTERPRQWLMVMLLFPLLSVLSQELLFRVIFFRRYAALLGQNLPLVMVVNAALFAWSHIIFDNLPALLIAFAGSLLFSWRYHRTRSFWAVVVEHSLYGNLMFTLGMGRFFYTGAAAMGG